MMLLTLLACTCGPAPLTLNGNGATFPKMFYQASIAAYAERAPGIVVNYASDGSGTGRQNLADRVVDWAGSDVPISDAERPKFRGAEVLHFPTVSAPITVIYNLPGVADLRLSCPTIAKLVQGDIQVWNNPAIVAENPGQALPDQRVLVVVRSDGSGTTENFTRFLDRACGTGGDGTFRLKPAATVEWPSSVSAERGSGRVATAVGETVGAMGYLDLADARSVGLSVASVQNREGQYVAPTLASAQAAVATVTARPDLTFDPIWAPGGASYPITAPTWVLVYAAQPDAARAEALRGFLRFVLTDGQGLAEGVHFSPLPESIRSSALAQVDRIHGP